MNLVCHVEVNFTLVSMGDDVTRSRSIHMYMYTYIYVCTCGSRPCMVCIYRYVYVHGGLIVGTVMRSITIYGIILPHQFLILVAKKINNGV